MELGVISSSLTEVYEEQVAEYQARLARPGRAQVYVTASGSVPPGRYRLRQGDPVRAGTRPDLADVQDAHPAREFAYAAPQHAYAGPSARLAGRGSGGPAGDPGPDGRGRHDHDHGSRAWPPSPRSGWSPAPRWRKPGCRAPGPGAGRLS